MGSGHPSVVPAGSPAMAPPGVMITPAPAPAVPCTPAETVIGPIPSIPGIVPGVVPSEAHIPQEGVAVIEAMIAMQAHGIVIVIAEFAVGIIVFILVAHQVFLIGQGVGLLHIQRVTVQACQHLSAATTVVFIHIAQRTAMIISLLGLGFRCRIHHTLHYLLFYLLFGLFCLGRNKIHVIGLGMYGHRHYDEGQHKHEFTCHNLCFLSFTPQN